MEFSKELLKLFSKTLRNKAPILRGFILALGYIQGLRVIEKTHFNYNVNATDLV
jgi:hypothetical protein